MSFKASLGAALVAAAFGTAFGAAAGPRAVRAPQAAANAGGSWRTAAEVLVRFRNGTSRARVDAVAESIGGEVVETFQIVPDLQLLRVPEALAVDDAIARYKEDPDVLYAQPNFVYRVDRTPDDPLYPTMYNLDNIGQTGGMPDADIDAPEAWDSVTGSTRVAVGDIDTGIDYEHEDLAASARANLAECRGAAGVDDDSNGYVDDCHGIDTINGDSDPRDDNGHGTHTAGTIGATGNNGTGVTGVNWNVTIVACKSHNSFGSGTSASIIACMQYMEIEKAHGLNVVATNNSYGGCPEACGLDRATYDAIRSNMEKGILFVAAAGNAGSDNDSLPTYPASYFLPNVIAVAATNSSDALARFSNFGERTVLVGAPGVRIESTSPKNRYSFFSGTSMAAPHVTGLAALLKAQNTRRSWWSIRNLILAGGEGKLSLAGRTVTGRRIDAFGSAICSGKRFFGVLRPLETQSGQPVPIAAVNVNCARRVTDSLTVTITPGGAIVHLLDDGTGADLAAKDGVLSGAWSPSPCSPGTYAFRFSTGASVQATVTC